MFEVIFEVCPRPERWGDYLAIAKSLRPLLEAQHGFIENIRYKSLKRPGWVLSLSDWENEKALVRWRTQMKHHHAQEKGRETILADYHLRVGETISDTSPASENRTGRQERLDETEVGEAKAAIIINTSRLELGIPQSGEMELGTEAESIVDRLGFDVKRCHGLVSWDVFEAILTPGDLLVLCWWVDQNAGDHALEGLQSRQRMRQVRIIRDYGMFDRVEAPQYYPDVEA